MVNFINFGNLFWRITEKDKKNMILNVLLIKVYYHIILSMLTRTSLVLKDKAFEDTCILYH